MLVYNGRCNHFNNVFINLHGLRQIMNIANPGSAVNHNIECCIRLLTSLTDNEE